MRRMQGRPLMAVIGTVDMERALGFYNGVLGLSIISGDEFGTSLEAGGTELRLTRVPVVVTTPYSQLAWRVTNLNGVVASLREAGINTVDFEHLDQDEAGAWTGPGGVRVAWFYDPDENLLSMVEDAQR